MDREASERIVSALPAACQPVYGDRLRALARHGSVARGTMRPDSGMDLLIVAEPLPPARRFRLEKFGVVEKGWSRWLDEARS